MKQRTTKLILLLSALLITINSCSKSDVSEIEHYGWNALTFTESKESNYQLYKDSRHVNITFPTLLDRGKIDYKNGYYRRGELTYIFLAHNWGEEELELLIFKENEIFKEVILKPLPEISPAGVSPIKVFNLELDLSEGEYSFRASIVDQGERRSLYTHELHDTKNRLLIVKER